MFLSAMKAMRVLTKWMFLVVSFRWMFLDDVDEVCRCLVSWRHIFECSFEELLLWLEGFASVVQWVGRVASGFNEFCEFSFSQLYYD